MGRISPAHSFFKVYIRTSPIFYLMVLRGKKQVLKNLVTARILAEAAADHASAEAAAELAEIAKDEVPVRDGLLKSSIVDGKIKTGVYEVSTNVEYAPWVEFGTSKMRAQPYMQPAIDVMQKKFPSLIKGGLASRLGGL